MQAWAKRLHVVQKNKQQPASWSAHFYRHHWSRSVNCFCYFLFLGKDSQAKGPLGDAKTIEGSICLMSDVTAKSWPADMKILNLWWKNSWEKCRDKTCISKDLSASWCMLQVWLELAFIGKAPTSKAAWLWAQVGQGIHCSSPPTHSLFCTPVCHSDFWEADILKWSAI